MGNIRLSLFHHVVWTRDFHIRLHHKIPSADRGGVIASAIAIGTAYAGYDYQMLCRRGGHPDKLHYPGVHAALQKQTSNTLIFFYEQQEKSFSERKP